jgi:hypothetical protein
MPLCPSLVLVHGEGGIKKSKRKPKKGKRKKKIGSEKVRCVQKEASLAERVL